jgi:hypothetical protein
VICGYIRGLFGTRVTRVGDGTRVGERQAGVALVTGTNSSIELLLQDADAPDAKVV